ncbi:hypothetical protein [Angustibacter luteus]|uniref:Uncharacterized protein n=1 Tax=Angustibacter luteus TaxID=658456 RepID=A0ABW1JEP1_9ACTN
MTWTELRRGWDGAAPAVLLAAGLLLAPALHGQGIGVATGVVGALSLACCVGVRLPTAVLVAVLGWLLVTGFDGHRWGQLTPVTGTDVVRLLALTGGSVGAALASRLVRRHRGTASWTSATVDVDRAPRRAINHGATSVR